LVAVPSIGRASQVTPRRAAPEADATRELYERYARQIYSYCLHQLGNREEAEDATQSTFLNAFRGIQRGVDPEFESAWLYKIAQNVCLTRQRSSSRRRRVESPGDLEAMQDYVPAHQADPDELIRLPEALESMPEQQRKALLLREWQGLSYKEIAGELDLSQAAVETLLFRARRTLANELADAPPNKSSAGRRLRRSGDAGTMVAIAKSILFTGGTKVAATVATVAATSVVAAAPATRHVVTDVVTPGHDRQAPVAHVAHVAAKPKAKPVGAAAGTPVAVPAVVHYTGAPVAAAKKTTFAKHAVHHRALARAHKTLRAFMPGHRSRVAVEPAAVAPAASAPAPVAPAPTPPAAETPPAAADPAPAAAPPIVPSQSSKKHDSGKGGDDSKHRGHGRKDDHGKGKSAPTLPSQPSTPAATPTTANTPPFVPPATAGAGDDHSGKHDGDRHGGGHRDDKPSTSTSNSTQTTPTTTTTTATTTTPALPPATPTTTSTPPFVPPATTPAQPEGGSADKGDHHEEGHRRDGRGDHGK